MAEDWVAGEEGEREGEEGADGVGVGCETEEDKPLISFAKGSLRKAIRDCRFQYTKFLLKLIY